MNLIIRENINNVEEFNLLYDAVGWGAYNSEIKIENPDLRVYLGASKGKEDFYKKFGFITRIEYGVGEGMILK